MEEKTIWGHDIQFWFFMWKATLGVMFLAMLMIAHDLGK